MGVFFHNLNLEQGKFILKYIEYGDLSPFHLFFIMQGKQESLRERQHCRGKGLPCFISEQELNPVVPAIALWLCANL